MTSLRLFGNNILRRRKQTDNDRFRCNHLHFDMLDRIGYPQAQDLNFIN